MDTRRAFSEVVERLEDGKMALVSAVPTARADGTPLAEALHAFEDALRQARDAMHQWRSVETESTWWACSAALDEAGRRAERLRLEAPSLDYEGLVMTLGDLIAPLEVFADAARRIR
jgi:exonuclease VII small subunit